MGSNRAAAMLPGIPIAAPIASMVKVSRRTIRVTPVREAPKAIRTPISDRCQEEADEAENGRHIGNKALEHETAIELLANGSNTVHRNIGRFMSEGASNGRGHRGRIARGAEDQVGAVHCPDRMEPCRVEARRLTFPGAMFLSVGADADDFAGLARCWVFVGDVAPDRIGSGKKFIREGFVNDAVSYRSHEELLRTEVE
jgi:hypothetical protein